MRVAEDEPVPGGILLQPKIEAEIAFVLHADLDHEAPGLTAIRSAIDYAVATLEIVSSRIRGWDIRMADTVADNASSGLFVLGSRRSAGSGADGMGDP